VPTVSLFLLALPLHTLEENKGAQNTVLSSGAKFRIDTDRLAVCASFLGATGKIRHPLNRYPDVAR
jgi:hypothetical protein